jgi:hypothetical protein
MDAPQPLSLQEVASGIGSSEWDVFMSVERHGPAQGSPVGLTPYTGVLKLFRLGQRLDSLRQDQAHQRGGLGDWFFGVSGF